MGPRRTQGLVDILDRILDKGLVIAGDIQVGLANVELLTIRIRLLVCSVDKAQEIGLNWWRHDPYLTGPLENRSQLADLGEQLGRIERRLDELETRKLK